MSSKSEDIIFDRWLKKCFSLSRYEEINSLELSLNEKSEVIENVNCEDSFETKYLELQREVQQYVMLNLLQGSSFNDRLSEWVQYLSTESKSLFHNYTSTGSTCFLPIISGCLDARAQNDAITTTTDVEVALVEFVLPYCAYNKHDSSDNDRYVRDCAMHCLTILTSSGQRIDALELLHFAKRGVELYVSASTSTTTSPVQDEEENHLPTEISTNMSALIRVQRSICIQVLKTALLQYNASNYNVAMNKRTTDDEEKCCKIMAEYTTFCCSCLHGETDPRCLLDFFHLIHLCQTVCNASDTARYFPEVEVFESVAPYYPIRFIPPPNDPHGITRHDLRVALNQILLYPPSSATTEEVLSYPPQNMFSLTFSLFLEQLAEVSEEDEDEQESDGKIIFEACDDLLHLIFTATTEVEPVQNFTTTDEGTTIALHTAITPRMLEELSDCLHNLFYHYMQHYPQRQQQEQEQEQQHQQQQHQQQHQHHGQYRDSSKYHPVAEKCLSVVSKVSNAAKEEKLWKAFHLTPKISNMITNIIVQSPHLMEAKIGVIYLRTLLSSNTSASDALIDQVLMPLIDPLQAIYRERGTQHENYDEQEERRVVASLYATSTLTTAYSMNRSSYSPSVADRIPRSFPKTLLDYSNSTCPAIAAAAVSTLESLLLSHSYTLSSDSKEITISFKFLCETLHFQLDCILDTKYNNETYTERNQSSAHSIGTLLGSIFAGLEEDNESKSKSMRKTQLQMSFAGLKQTSEEVFSFIHSTIQTMLRNLLQRCANRSNHETRFDWMALSLSCHQSRIIAANAIESFTTILLTNNSSSTSVAAAAALRRLICHGGEHVIDVWKENNKAFDIVLMSLSTPKGKEQPILQEDLEAKVQIICTLIPAIDLLSDNEQFCQDMVNIFIDNNGEEGKVEVLLPVLASLACSSSNTCLPSVVLTREDSIQLLKYLCDRILKKWRFQSTSSNTERNAVLCVFSILASESLSDDQVSKVQVLLQESISPSIWQAFHQSKGEVDMSTQEEWFHDAVCLAAVMGAASAYQGRGDSAVLTDRVTEFLLDLCCDGILHLPYYSMTMPTTIARDAVSDEGQQMLSESVLSIVGGMAFGTMLTLHCNSLRSPFWKQRAASMAIIRLLNRIHSNEKSSYSSSTVPLGCLIALSHFVCCTTPLAALGDDGQIRAIAHAISRGLSSYIAVVPICRDREDIERRGISSFLTVGLSALLKIISLAPLNTLSLILVDTNYSVLSALLATLSMPKQQKGQQKPFWTADCGVYTRIEMDDDHVPRQLLALECFLQVSIRTTIWKESKIRNAIIHTLSLALDSPSYAVRRAAGVIQNELLKS